MSRHTVAILLGKLGLLFLPFAIIFSVYLFRAQPPYALQQSVLWDKIDRLVLSPAQKPRVLFAGDSRAEDNIIPDLFTQKTGLSSVNVAVGGGALSDAYDALNRAGALNKKRLIVISVSSYEINDSYFDDRPINFSILMAEPFGLHKATSGLAYLENRAASYYAGLRRFLRGDRTDYSHMDETTFRHKGYLPKDGLLDPLPDMVRTVSWYVDLKADGLKRKDLERAIDGFGHTNDTIVIYDGPIAPAWRSGLIGTPAPEAEAHFAEVVRTAAAAYPNIHFINFHAANIPELGDAEFSDVVHLNVKGASIFTSLLAERLKKDRLLPH